MKELKEPSQFTVVMEKVLTTTVVIFIMFGVQENIMRLLNQHTPNIVPSYLSTIFYRSMMIFSVNI